MWPIVIIIVGFFIGVKTTLWTQLLLLIITIISGYSSKDEGLGPWTIICLVLVNLLVGVFLGDCFYYYEHYESSKGFAEFMSWFIRP